MTDSYVHGNVAVEIAGEWENGQIPNLSLEKWVTYHHKKKKTEENLNSRQAVKNQQSPGVGTREDNDMMIMT